MSVIATAVKHMLSAGMAPADIVAAVEEMEAACVPNRTGRQERNRRYYEKHKASEKRLNASETSELDDLPSEGSPSPTPPSLPNQPSTPPISPPAENRRAAPQIVLQAILDPMTARRWVDHCGRMSEETAQAHVAALRDIKAKGGNPVDAVALAIKRGWRTLELEWLVKAGLKLASPQATQIDWSAAMQVWRDDETWSPMWGPKPGERGCRVPPELLRGSAA